MPTSAGKTRIAELAIVHTLAKNPGAKCIYVAPYRALASEIEQSFLTLLSDLGYRVSSITGLYESDDFEDLLFRETEIIVTTPERLDLLLRAHPEFLDNVRLVALDEGHIVHDKHRGVKFELLVTRLKRRLPLARFLLLSAVVPQQNLEDFAQWLKASSQEDILTTSWRPSIQRYAKFEWQGQTGVIRYATEEDIYLLRDFVPGVIRQQEFEFRNPQTARMNRRIFPESDNKAQIAAELAFKFAELGPVLIFCTQTNLVKSVAHALHRRLELAKLTGNGLPPYFEDTSETRSFLIAREWLGSDQLVDWLKSGIAVHYGTLPDPIRSAVETDVRQRRLKVLIATNTLAQGVNLPFRTVIVHSCRRYDEEEASQKRILAREYWNIAGRAGRAGEETEGLIIHIAISPQDHADFRFFLSRRNNVEPVQSALFEKLLALVQDRLSEDALKADLDAEVLALLVEEDQFENQDTALEDILDESLVGIQARRLSGTLERLKQVVSDLKKNITQRVPDRGLISAYSSTGLSSESCDLILLDITSRAMLISDLLGNGDIRRLGEIIETLLPVCLDLVEMRSGREFGGSYKALLQQWMEGAEVDQLMIEFKNETNSREDLVRFIDEVFRYRLPWGIAAYIRLALKILNMERRDLSNFVSFLPSMVKFGLSDPVACWAMALGIPSRRMCIRLASTFRNETSQVDFRAFLRWLGTLNTDRLLFDFGLVSPLLEDVSRVINLASLNPILRQFTKLDSFLPRNVEVRGIIYENRSIVALQAKRGMGVDIVRDYDNLVDRNAIAVYLSNQMLGFIPREVAQVLAPEMDIGVQLYGTVVETSSDQTPRIYIQIGHSK